jgi:hypothetical protein
LIGLPGAPSGNRSLMALGTRNMQLSHASPSDSEPTLNLLTELLALCVLLFGTRWSGKYGLCAPSFPLACGLAGGESNGESRAALLLCCTVVFRWCRPAAGCVS